MNTTLIKGAIVTTIVVSGLALLTQAQQSGIKRTDLQQHDLRKRRWFRDLFRGGDDVYAVRAKEGTVRQDGKNPY